MDLSVEPVANFLLLHTCKKLFCKWKLQPRYCYYQHSLQAEGQSMFDCLKELLTATRSSPVLLPSSLSYAGIMGYRL